MPVIVAVRLIDAVSRTGNRVIQNFLNMFFCIRRLPFGDAYNAMTLLTLRPALSRSLASLDRLVLGEHCEARFLVHLRLQL